MEETIKISVLIPAYNVEQYIDQCLESVMGQTLRQIEIIVVDDCSTDNTLAHIEAAAERDKRVRIIRHEVNRGTYMARKNAVLASHGEYIMFVDSDDWIELNACEIAYTRICKANVDVLNFDIMIENCGNLSQDRIERKRKKFAPYQGPPLTEPLVTACFVRKKFIWVLWNKIYRGDLTRNIFSRLSDNRIYWAEDVFQNFFLLLACRTYQASEDQLYHYCYGRGMSGKTATSLNDFQLRLSSAKVSRAIEQNLAALENGTPEEIGKEMIAAAHEAARAIKRNTIAAHLNDWLKYVMPEDKAEAYLMMESAWQMDPSAFAGMVAQVGWEKRKEVAEALADADYLKFEARPIKTIAIYYSKLRNGGIERVIALLSSMLAELTDENGDPRYKVVLILEEESNEEDYPVSRLVIRERIPPKEDSIADNYLLRAAAWARIVRQYGVDVVFYSHWRSALQLWDILSIKRTERKPAVVIHTHNWCATMYLEQSNCIEEREKVFSLTEGIVVLSEMDRMYWSRVNSRVYMIHNPCFAKASESKRARFGKHILWVARIHKQKQPLEIPRIMREVVARDPDIICHVVGDQDAKLRAKLEGAILAEGLSENVILEGFHPDVAPFYESCSLFLMTSHYEGFALTLYEAASFGLPTVMYELPWLSYCYDMEGWISVPQLNAKAAAEAVVRIVNCPEEWQIRSDALYQSALAYEKKDIAPIWLSLLSDLEQGRIPKAPDLDESTRLFLDQLDHFHGMTVRALVKNGDNLRQNASKLQELLKESQSIEKKALEEAQEAKEKANTACTKTKKAQAETQTALEEMQKARQEAQEAQVKAKKARAKAKKAQAETQIALEEMQKAQAEAQKAQEAIMLALKKEAKAREAEKALQEKLYRIETSRTYRFARVLGKPVRWLKLMLKWFSALGTKSS